MRTTGGMPSSTSNGKGRIVFNLFKLNLLDIFYKDFGHRASKITQHKSDNLTHNFTNGICHIFENIWVLFGSEQSLNFDIKKDICSLYFSLVSVVKFFFEKLWTGLEKYQLEKLDDSFDTKIIVGHSTFKACYFAHICNVNRQKHSTSF